MGFRLTQTEANTFQDCKRRWWLGTYRRLQRKAGPEFNRPLRIGERLHKALEAYYQPGDYRTDPFETLEIGIAEDLYDYPTAEDEILKEADLVWIMLEGYMEWLEEEGLDSDIRVVEPEAEIEVPLIPDQDITLLSKVDVQVERISDGKRGGIETKSVGDLKKPVRKLQVDPQLLTEHLVQYLDLLEKGEDAESNRAEFILYNMLRKVKRTARAKPPFYGRETVFHSVEELRSHWKHMFGIATDIAAIRARLDAGEDPHVVTPPHVTNECFWKCEFAEACLAGMFDDGSNVEAYLDEHYEEGDPLARYVDKNAPEEG